MHARKCHLTDRPKAREIGLAACIDDDAAHMKVGRTRDGHRHPRGVDAMRKTGRQRRRKMLASGGIEDYPGIHENLAAIDLLLPNGARYDVTRRKFGS